MKKFLLLLLALVLCLSMVACGDNKDKKDKDDDDSSTSEAANESLAGMYKIDSATISGKTYTGDALAEVNLAGSYVKIAEDNTCVVSLGDTKFIPNVDFEAGTMTFSGETSPFTIDGNTITIIDNEAGMSVTFKK